MALGLADTLLEISCTRVAHVKVVRRTLRTSPPPLCLFYHTNYYAMVIRVRDMVANAVCEYCCRVQGKFERGDARGY